METTASYLQYFLFNIKLNDMKSYQTKVYVCMTKIPDILELLNMY